MSPIIGIIASSISGNIATNSYESIATINASGSSATIEFTSIPSTYVHLQLRCITKSVTTADNFETITFQVGNGSVDTGNNYSRHYLQGDGASPYAGGQGTQNSYNYSYAAGSNTGKTNMFSVNIYDILDYKNTNKYKTIRHLGGWDFNGSGFVTYGSAAWQSTSAITDIKLTIPNNFNSNSTFALYGVKA